MIFDIANGQVIVEGEVVAYFSAYRVNAGELPPEDCSELLSPAEDIIYLQNINVSPHFRRQGICRSLVNKLLERGRPVVIYPMPIEVECGDLVQWQTEQLKGWYRSMGFVEKGHMMFLYGADPNSSLAKSCC